MHRVATTALALCAFSLPFSLPGQVPTSNSAPSARPVGPVPPSSQTPPPNTPRPTMMDSEGKPIASDPILLAPTESLNQTEIKRLQTMLGDYAQFSRYHAANASLPASEPGRVVFYGDSITDAWGNGANAKTFFPGKPYIDRGISGQTTPQMLIRFQQDVVALKPAAVVILAGTNDIAGNTGPETPEMIQNNFRSMAAIADASGIKLILSSTLPVDDYAWRRGLQPAEKVRALNTWMKDFCAEHHYIYLDYYTALATPEGAMKPGTSKDGVHPTAAGYAIMAPLAQAAIDQALTAH
ncbi:MAG: SGNH/GDSL hydrolase family protein [Janthinobacterium lividum]